MIDYNSVNKTLKSAITRIDKGAGKYVLTPKQKEIIKQQKKDLSDCIELVKRVNSFGGINTLISQAQKAAGNGLFDGPAHNL